MKNTREYGKKGQNRFLEVAFWETPRNFRKYNWILFTKFSWLQFLNILSEKQNQTMTESEIYRRFRKVAGFCV